jgi:hypothetical protein
MVAKRSAVSDRLSDRNAGKKKFEAERLELKADG